MNFKESRAIYLQIADRICDDILSFRFKEEERIPSVREYAAIVEVNANTVMRSYDYLQQLNIIFNKRGIGYFVSPGAVLLIRKVRKEAFLCKKKFPSSSGSCISWRYRWSESSIYIRSLLKNNKKRTNNEKDNIYSVWTDGRRIYSHLLCDEMDEW
jgi:GntR family transcriptional regulator